MTTRELDVEISALAGRQHGIVARAQLTRLGLGRRAIERRLERRRLHIVFRGAYAVGHTVVSRRGRWMAAVLCGGDGAVLSHRSAAALWGMAADPAAAIEITAPRRLRGEPLISAHRGRPAPDEVTVTDGIPTTTVARSLLDLAAVVDRRRVERALTECEVLGLTGILSLPDLLARHPGRRGAATVGAILAAERDGADLTRSELEERFLEFLERFGLPPPAVNTLVEAGGHRFEVDCRWSAAGLVVELDGHASHGTRLAYERDRRRDRLLQGAGWRVVRVTWRQLHDEPEAIAADLRWLLRPAATG